jgi:hypothetical protein
MWFVPDRRIEAVMTSEESPPHAAGQKPRA